MAAVRHRVYLVFVCRNCYVATETSRREVNHRMAASMLAILYAAGEITEEQYERLRRERA